MGEAPAAATYLIFWGRDWANGFTTTDASGGPYKSQQLQNYVTSFLGNVGGTSWAAIQDEYCNNVPAGTTNLPKVGRGSAIIKPRRQIEGVRCDTWAMPRADEILWPAGRPADQPHPL